MYFLCHTVHVLSSHKRPVASLLENTDTEHFHHRRNFYWTVLPEKLSFTYTLTLTANTHAFHLFFSPLLSSFHPFSTSNPSSLDRAGLEEGGIETAMVGESHGAKRNWRPLHLQPEWNFLYRIPNNYTVCEAVCHTNTLLVPIFQFSQIASS